MAIRQVDHRITAVIRRGSNWMAVTIRRCYWWIARALGLGQVWFYNEENKTKKKSFWKWHYIKIRVKVRTQLLLTWWPILFYLSKRLSRISRLCEVPKCWVGFSNIITRQLLQLNNETIFSDILLYRAEFFNEWNSNIWLFEQNYKKWWRCLWIDLCRPDLKELKKHFIPNDGYLKPSFFENQVKNLIACWVSW